MKISANKFLDDCHPSTEWRGKKNLESEKPVDGSFFLFPQAEGGKMAPSTSSVSTAPVISPRCVRASLSSRAVNSGLSWREMDSEASRTCSRQRPSSCWCRALMATRELPVSPGREEEKAWIMASSNSFFLPRWRRKTGCRARPSSPDGLPGRTCSE